MTLVPTRIVENRPSPFPEGVYMGRIKQVDERWNDDQTRLNFTIVMKDITLVEGDTNPGARPYRFRLPVIWDGISLVDIEEFTDDTPFLLERAAGTLSQLAQALGLGEQTALGTEVDFQELLEGLQEGQYNDIDVLFGVAHRTYTIKSTGKQAVDDGPSFFKPVDGDEEEYEEAEADEAEAAEVEEEAAPPAKRPKNLRRR